MSTSFRKYLLTLVVFFLCLYNLQSSAWAADGDLDPTFGEGGVSTTSIGIQEEANSIALQSDGKIVLAGYSNNGSGNDFAVVRYNSDGSLDTSFDSDGKLTTDFGSSDLGNSVIVQNDGKIIVAGKARNGSFDYFAVVKYNSDGSLDTSFDSDGKLTTDIGSLNDIATSVVLQSDGKIVVAGYSNNGSGNDFAVVRYNSDGSLDTSFDSDGKLTTDFGSSDLGNSVIVQNDGKIIVAGQSYNGSNNDFAVVRYNADGSLDATFGTGGKKRTPIGSGSDVAWSVALQSDGKIVLAGYSSNGTGSDFAVVRYNSDGSLDTTFDSDGILTSDLGTNEEARSVVLQSDGKIVAAGYSYNGSNNDFAVVRYKADGSLDATFGTGGYKTTPIGSGDELATSVVLQSDGKIVLAGFSNNGSNVDFAVVRYLATPGSSNSPSNLWVGAQSISCPAPNPWLKEKLGFASNAKPVLVSAENTIGKTITQSSYDALRSSGVVFDTVSTKVSTATETLPVYGCKDKLLSGKVNQPIQFIAGGYTLQSDAHGYINTADLKWHDTNGVTLYTNTAAFMHTIKFTQTGKYVVVLTEQPDTGRGLIPTYGVRSVRFVININ